MTGLLNNNRPTHVGQGYRDTFAVNTTAATITLDPLVHDSRVLTIDAAAGCAVTLPAATGSAARYRICITTAVTSNSTTITAGSGDTYCGKIETATTTGATTNGFAEAMGGADHIITMNGTTTGGLIGSYLEFLDVKANLWLVTGVLVGSGTLATSIS